LPRRLLLHVDVAPARVREGEAAAGAARRNARERRLARVDVDGHDVARARDAAVRLAARVRRGAAVRRRRQTTLVRRVAEARVELPFPGILRVEPGVLTGERREELDVLDVGV